VVEVPKIPTFGGNADEIPQIEIPHIKMPNLPNVDLSNWQISTGMENMADVLKTQTYGGNSKGASCHFPFTYKNKVYTECTDVGSIGPFGSKSWCSTTPDYEEDKKWGKCIEIPQIKIPQIEIPQIEIPQIDLNDMDWQITVKNSG